MPMEMAVIFIQFWLSKEWDTAFVEVTSNYWQPPPPKSIPSSSWKERPGGEWPLYLSEVQSVKEDRRCTTFHLLEVEYGK